MLYYSGGSEAVEAFLRIAWVYTNKSGVWGGLVDPDEVGGDKPKCDQFHGWTLGARILAGRVTWSEFGVFPELGALRFGTVPTNTACMGMEPYHAPSGQFHKQEPTISRIMALRKEYPEILFLIDEIQGGMGRTGKLFAHEHYKDAKGFPQLRPDFVTLGKLVGAGFPMSVLCGPAEVMESEAVKDHAYLHSTHSWNPLACSVGCAVIEEMLKQNLIYESQRKGEIINEVFRDLGVRSFTAKDCLSGIELRDRPECDLVVERCRSAGRFCH